MHMYTEDLALNNLQWFTWWLQTFLYRHLKLSKTLENSGCYCYTSYEMTDQFLWFQFKWTATEAIGIHPTKAWLSQLVNFKNATWHFRRTIYNKILFWTKCHRNVWNASDCFSRWASRQFCTLPIVQTLLPVTFGYSLSSEAFVMRQLSKWKRPWQRYNKCIAAGGDYFEGD